MVGGDYVPRNIQCLADDGRHVSIAVQGGMTATIPIFEIMRRRLTLTGSTLRGRDTAFKSLVADELARTVWPHVEAGRLKPLLDRTYPLADAAEAQRRMEAGGSRREDRAGDEGRRRDVTIVSAFAGTTRFRYRQTGGRHGP